jgi:hypothetical protein
MILRNLSLVLLVLSLKASLPAMAQEGDTVIATRGKEMNIYAEDNETNCLVCHGKLVYTLTDTLTGTVRKQLMSEHNLVVPDLFYSSVHWSFSCLDCHSEGFKTFPHPLETRFETTWGCIDCHGYDPNYAQYRFEEIDQE